MLIPVRDGSSGSRGAAIGLVCLAVRLLTLHAAVPHIQAAAAQLQLSHAQIFWILAAGSTRVQQHRQRQAPASADSFVTRLFMA